MPIAILVHGGAGPTQPGDDGTALGEGCLAAARAGYRVLAQGGSALDAVEAAAVVLEDDPRFNAGTGACLNAAGEVELDASLMEGERLRAGAVAAVQGVANPIRLARLVMERTPHVLFCAGGAVQLAREHGFPLCDWRTLVTPKAVERLRLELERREREARASASGGGGAGQGGGTIGAVAIDVRGHLAAATSTGGMTAKRPGRIGDTPLIGAGTYADDEAGAASATGHGESIIKVLLAKHACDLLRAGAPATEAARQALARLDRVQGTGGLILVDRAGRIGFHFNTARMSHAWVDEAGAEGHGYLLPP